MTRQEVLKLRRRVQKLAALLLRLVLALLQASGFRLTLARLPEGRDKLRILRTVDRARESGCARRRWRNFLLTWPGDRERSQQKARDHIRGRRQSV